MRNTGTSNHRDTAALVAALAAGIIGTWLLSLMWDFGGASAIVLFILLSLLVWVLVSVVWVWSDPNYFGEDAQAGTSGGASESAASAVAAGTETVALHTPIPEAAADHVSIKATVDLSGNKPEGVSPDGTVSLHAPVPDAAADHVTIGSTVELRSPDTGADEAEEIDSATGPDDSDGDGGEAMPQSRPAALEGPRDGGADDLKLIKGIGPALEKLCNSLGFYHFDQIAAWTDEEVAWVDQNLEGFKGRVTRDAWVEQARTLAGGGTTEFSEKAGKGGAN